MEIVRCHWINYHLNKSQFSKWHFVQAQHEKTNDTDMTCPLWTSCWSQTFIWNVSWEPKRYGTSYGTQIIYSLYIDLHRIISSMMTRWYFSKVRIICLEYLRSHRSISWSIPASCNRLVPGSGWRPTDDRPGTYIVPTGCVPAENYAGLI